ncbi:MAG: DUF1700 domain-containing protein [Lachnospiraceae bacterium]|uniref:DUF1700 domain-containing protein n=1 Tax=Roseburia sp. 1XD42-69 TaxID=2320088 RepID=UPI000EA13201|nr:DUF1700 domain-containing protein [Roseburia sp. 1XD42-69]MCI8876264.1 DUF1700 domain-containing protein [Lachnospiraceae bacterium]RKJ60908.1 DUF1700 domain-containing protein [Roseburia sp. 1XD42-69]
MDRESYIRELRLALQGQISQENVNEHLRYYENYIIEESRKGRTEAQVIEDLGNPRLIAKTIIDTTDKIYTEQSSQEGREEKSRKFKLFQYGKRVAFLVFLVLMLLLIAHVAIVLIPVFLPVLLITCVIYFLFFSNRK